MAETITLPCNHQEFAETVTLLMNHLSGEDGRKRLTILQKYLKGEISLPEILPSWLKESLRLVYKQESFDLITTKDISGGLTIEPWAKEAMELDAVKNVRTTGSASIVYLKSSDLKLSGRVSLEQFINESTRYAKFIKPLPVDGGIHLQAQIGHIPEGQVIFVASDPFIPKKDTRPHLFRIAHFKQKNKKKDGVTLSVVRIANDRFVTENDLVAFEMVQR